MPTGTGIGIDFSQLDAAFKSLDAQLRKLTTEGENFGKTMRDAFKSMSGAEFQNFLNGLTDLRKQIVGSSKDGIFGFGKQKMLMNWDSAGLQKYIDDINRLIYVIKAVQAEGKGAGLSTKGLQITGLKNEVKEAEELLRIIRRVEKEAAAATKASNQTYAGAMAYSRGTQTIEQEAYAIANLEAAKKKLVQTDANYKSQLNALNEEIQRHKKNIADANKTDQQRADEATKNAEKIAKAREREQRAAEAARKRAESEQRRIQREQERTQRAAELAQRQTYSGALSYSQNATTLRQERQAIKYLEAARANLSKTDADYSTKLQTLNKRILEHKNNIDKATAGSKNLQKSHRSLMDISGQLARKLALVFSVSQIQGYVNKMIQVRGEFELQQRSLQAIIQDKDKANEVWQKTVDLAVRSPFRVGELVKYTKQLAAYRIESDKLYETNKMLADVSAGLGVDMSRLILAYGQVRSAQYLRGTELRQFTEAGIPMLEELAKLYGKNVNEVFEMISKRMVVFEDVEEVFKRMTAAGGTFYNMQEIQAETLKGQISNLKDSVDLMMNSIGKSMDGPLKRGVSIVKSIVDNYQLVVNVVKALVASFAIYKINALSASKSTIAWASSLGVSVKAGKTQLTIMQLLKAGAFQVSAAFKAMGSSLMSIVATNPLIALLAALTAVVAQWWKYEKRIREVKKTYQQMLDTQSEVSVRYRKATDIDEKKDALKDLIEFANKEYDLKINIDVDAIEASEELDKTISEVRQKMLNANAFGATFAEELIKADRNTKWDAGWIGVMGVFEQGMLKDIDQMGDSYDDLNRIMLNKLAPTIDNLSEKWSTLSDTSKAAIKSLKTDIGGEGYEGEDIAEYFDRIRESYEVLMKAGDVSDSKLNSQLRKYERRMAEAQGEFRTFIKRIDETVRSKTDEEKVVFISAAIDEAKTQQNWSEFEETQLRKWLEKEYNIELTPVIADKDPNLEAWQKTYNKLFAGYEGFREITKQNATQKQQIDRLNGSYETTLELITRIKKAGEGATATGGAYEGMNLEALEAKLAEIKAQLDWFGANTQKKTGRGKDLVLEKLKERISFIKETNQEYEKLLENMAEEEARQEVINAMKETAKKLDLDIAKMVFTDKGTAYTFADLLTFPEYVNSAKAEEYLLEIQKAMDNYTVQLKVDAKIEARERLSDQVDELFDRQELTKELKKLGVNEEVASALFGFDSLSLQQLKAEVQKMESAFLATGEKGAEKYEQIIKKITDMEVKEQRERMKKYVEYARYSVGERAKIKLEELQKLKEIEETFKAKDGDSEEVKASKKDLRERASKRAKQESADALRKLEWEEFQKTETFTSMFADIDDASDALITHMIGKIKEFKDEWKNMPLEDVRAMVNKLNELEASLAERSPWKSYRDAKDAVRQARENAKFSFESDDARDLYGKGKSDKDYIAALQIENAYQEEKAANTEKEMAVIEEILALKTKTREGSVVDLGLTREQMEYTKLTEKELRDLLDGKEKEVKDAHAIVLANGQVLVQYKHQEKSLNKQAEVLGEVQNMANDLYDAFKELGEALGADEDSPAAIFADMGMNMMNAVLNTMMLQAQLKAVEVGAYAAGTALNAAMGVIGWIVMGVQLLSQAISAIAKAKDNALLATVEEEARKVEALQEEYEKLEDAIDNAWDVASIQAYNQELRSTTEEMIRAQKAAIAAQEQRKGANREGSEKWEELQDMYAELDELETQLEESLADSFSKVTDGILDSVQDAARDFTDAWWDAFVETGDGLKGLEENFNEMFLNLAKNQAAMQITGAFADRWKKDLEEYINEDDTELTKDEAKAWAEKVRKTFPELSAALEAYLGAFKGFADSEAGGLSALQKGIQGVTEETAQVIEALLSSMRFYVADSNQELKNQTRYMRDMYNLLNGMTMAHSQGGRGIKVVM